MYILDSSLELFRFVDFASVEEWVPSSEAGRLCQQYAMHKLCKWTSAACAVDAFHLRSMYPSHVLWHRKTVMKFLDLLYHLYVSSEIEASPHR